jgi:ribosomal protein S18 acetylase RimI-like enzyme
MGVSIHVPHPSNYAALARLLTTVYAGEGYRSQPLDRSDVVTLAEQALLLVALDADADFRGTRVVGIVGLARGGNGATRVAVIGEGEVQRLAVAQDARSKGVGRALVEECVARSRAAGDLRLVLWTQPSMTSAQRLYERMGFERRPDRDTPDPRGFQRLVYALEVGAQPGRES